MEDVKRRLNKIVLPRGYLFNYFDWAHKIELLYYNNTVAEFRENEEITQQKVDQVIQRFEKLSQPEVKEMLNDLKRELS